MWRRGFRAWVLVPGVALLLVAQLAQSFLESLGADAAAPLDHRVEDDLKQRVGRRRALELLQTAAHVHPLQLEARRRSPPRPLRRSPPRRARRSLPVALRSARRTLPLRRRARRAEGHLLRVRPVVQCRLGGSSGHAALSRRSADAPTRARHVGQHHLCLHRARLRVHRLAVRRARRAGELGRARAIGKAAGERVLARREPADAVIEGHHLLGQRGGAARLGLLAPLRLAVCHFRSRNLGRQRRRLLGLQRSVRLGCGLVHSQQRTTLGLGGRVHCLGRCRLGRKLRLHVAAGYFS